MKRSPLARRKTPLKPGEPKRTGKLRFRSAKTAKVERAVKDERKAYRDSYGVCPLCGERKVTSIHEFIGGRYRQRTVKDKRFWIPSCWSCHGEFLQHAKLTWQLCVKSLVDSQNYSLDAIRELYASDGRAPEVVTEAEVQAVRNEVLELFPNLKLWV